MSEKTSKWKIVLEIANELSINFNQSVSLQNNPIITFSDINATEEEMHQIIDSATKSERVIDIKFPANYKLLRFTTPYENLVSLTVSLDVENDSEKEMKMILKEVKDILNNEDTNEINT